MAEIIGYVLSLNAIITWALASLVYKFGLGKTEAKANIFFRLTIVSTSTLVLSFIFGNYSFLFDLNGTDLICYIVMCLFSGVSVSIGDIMYFMSLKKIDASRAYPLTQLSLVFVYPLAFFLFGEIISLSVLVGGFLILFSVFFLSSKDKPKESSIYKTEEINENSEKIKSSNIENQDDLITEDILVGVGLAIGTAMFWALAIVTFNQARIISGDVFVTNFMRIFLGTVVIGLIGIFQRDYYSGFKTENRPNIRYFLYIGLAGSLSLGFADSFFYKAAEINGLVLTSTITANTPMIQQIFSITLLKEKFRKRFIIAVILIIIGNYLIIFL